MNALTGVTLKVVSTAAFTAMAVLIKLVADRYPVGEITFCRSLFALIPVFIWVGARGELPQVFRTDHLSGHVLRASIGLTGMVLGFAALALLPIADATALGYAQPLLTVVLAALILHETVRVYRWTAVVVGLIGVLIILGDQAVEVEAGGPEGSLLGAVLQLGAAFVGAVVIIQIRRLSRTESSLTIVAYFSSFAALASLLSLPFGWNMPDAGDAVILVCAGICGGLGQAFMTESFRHADASVLAPFDYTSMIWALTAGVLFFDSWPTPLMLLGTAIVIASGLFVLYREHQLGIVRSRSKPAAPMPPPLA